MSGGDGWTWLTRVALATGLCVELEDLPPALLGGYAEALVPAVRDRLSMRAWGAAMRVGARALQQQQAHDLP